MIGSNKVWRKIISAFALFAGALALGAAVPNWNATIAQSDTAHVIGRPDAPLTVTEYMSYTCPHCAEFSRAGGPALTLGYIAPGKVRFEIRHLLRDPVDLTAAMLAWCGPKAKFAGNHDALLAAQDVWLGKAQRASEAQRARWITGTQTARRRAIASDLGFYDLFERRGYGRAALDRCLADDALATRLAKASAGYATDLHIDSTPSFAINGVVLAGTYGWPGLKPQLDARIPARTAG